MEKMKRKLSTISTDPVFECCYFHRFDREASTFRHLPMRVVNKGSITIEFYKSKDQSEENKIGILDMELPPALDLEVNIFSRRSIISFHLLIIAVPNSTPCHSLEQTETSHKSLYKLYKQFRANF